MKLDLADFIEGFATMSVPNGGLSTAFSPTRDFPQLVPKATFGLPLLILLSAVLIHLAINLLWINLPIFGVYFCLTILSWSLYKPARTSLRSLLTLMMVITVNSALVMGWLGIALGLMSSQKSTLENSGVVFIAAGAIILVLFTVYYRYFWEDGKHLFQSLAQIDHRYPVPTEQLDLILTFRGATRNLASLLAPYVIILMLFPTIAIMIFGRPSVNFAAFLCISVFFVPWLCGVVIARYLLQKEYLGEKDITILQ